MLRFVPVAVLFGAVGIGFSSFRFSPSSVPGLPVPDAVAAQIRGGADCQWYSTTDCQAPSEGRCNEDSPANNNVWQAGGNGQKGYPNDNNKVYCANGQSCTDSWTGGLQYCGS